MLKQLCTTQSGSVEAFPLYIWWSERHLRSRISPSEHDIYHNNVRRLRGNGLQLLSELILAVHYLNAQLGEHRDDLFARGVDLPMIIFQQYNATHSNLILIPTVEKSA